VPAAPVPPSAPLPFLQYVRTARSNPIAAFHADIYRQPIVEMSLWKLHTFIVSDPAAIRHILVDNAANYIKGSIEPRIGSASSSEDFTATEKWRDRRRIMSSIVDYRLNAGNSSIILESVQSLLARWNALPSGTVIDISAEMSQLALEIISRLVFSSDRGEITSVMERTFARNEVDPLFSLLDFFPLLEQPRAAFKRFRTHRRFRALTATIDRLITKRICEKTLNGDDLLARLMREQNTPTGQPLSRREIHAQIITAVGAGHHTVALALTWIWYLLSLHPAEEARLHAELHSVLAQPPEVTDISRLPCTRMLIDESLRLYPPVPVMAWRRARADDEVCGVKILRGATITIAPWVLHRHTKLWDHPELFEPQRFSPACTHARSRYAYLPFGTGPRVCIGAAFAMMEITLILATIAQRFRLRVLPGHPVEPQGLVTLRPRYGIKATLERR